MPGRPRLLDEQTRREICGLVATGYSMSAAAKYIGCDRGTLRREIQRNQEFAQRIGRAELEAEYEPLHAIQDASRKSWRAAAWLLERTRPEQYSRAAINLVKMETLQDFVSRCLEVIEHELAGTPEMQAAGQRLIRAIQQTSVELTMAAISTRDPRRLRQIIATMETHPEESADEMIAQLETRPEVAPSVQTPAAQAFAVVSDSLLVDAHVAAK